MATVLVIAVLWVIPMLRRLTNARQTLTYEVVVPLFEQEENDLLAMMEANRLQVSKSTMSKSASGVNYVWRAIGRPDDHKATMLALTTRKDVKEFRVV